MKKTTKKVEKKDKIDLEDFFNFCLAKLTEEIIGLQDKVSFYKRELRIYKTFVYIYAGILGLGIIAAFFI